MESKNDWKEVEESERKRNNNLVSRFGFNIREYAEENLNQEKLKIIKKKNRIAKTIAIFVIIAIIMLQFYSFDCKMQERAKAKLLNQMEDSYKEDFEIISNKTYGMGRGFYTMRMASIPKMEIHTVVDEEDYGTDFRQRYHKYYFEKWNDSVKDKFIIYESYEDYTYRHKTMKEWFLNYYTYIEVNNYDEMLSATEDIIKFIEYTGNRNIIMRTYIKIEDKLIDVHGTRGESNEQIRKNVIKEFNNIIK